MSQNLAISRFLTGVSLEPRIFKGSFEIEILNVSLDFFLSRMDVDSWSHWIYIM